MFEKFVLMHSFRLVFIWLFLSNLSVLFDYWCRLYIECPSIHNFNPYLNFHLILQRTFDFLQTLSYPFWSDVTKSFKLMNTISIQKRTFFNWNFIGIFCFQEIILNYLWILISTNNLQELLMTIMFKEVSSLKVCF